MLEMLIERPEMFPYLEIRPSGMEQLRAIHKTLTEDPRLQNNPEAKRDIEQQLMEKLQYLNDYGGDRFKVCLYGFSYLSFSLTWVIKDDEGFRHFCDGVLQFEGVSQPFGSVNIDPSGYWGIHT